MALSELIVGRKQRKGRLVLEAIAQYQPPGAGETARRMSDLHESPPPRKRARLSPLPSSGQEGDAATEVSAPQSFFSLVTQGAVHDAASSMLLMTTAHGSDETSTDDEELQQLSMVGKVASQAGATGVKQEDDAEVGELVYEDVESVLFHTAKEQKLPMLQRSLRYIKRSKNADEIMTRIVKAEDETGLTLLMIAVRNNLLRLCTFLLQEGADVNQNNVRLCFVVSMDEWMLIGLGCVCIGKANVCSIAGCPERAGANDQVSCGARSQ